VPGQQVAIAHALERAVERVLAHALLQLAVVAEQIVLGRFELFEQVPDDLDGLHRQRHDVGWNVLGHWRFLRMSTWSCFTTSGGMIQRP
jgi:hypothetical protein